MWSAPAAKTQAIAEASEGISGSLRYSGAISSVPYGYAIALLVGALVRWVRAGVTGGYTAARYHKSVVKGYVHCYPELVSLK